MDELLVHVLAALGKTQAEFDAEVDEAKKESSTENIGILVAMLIDNSEATGLMVANLLQEIEKLKQEINELKGGAA